MSSVTGAGARVVTRPLRLVNTCSSSGALGALVVDRPLPRRVNCCSSSTGKGAAVVTREPRLVCTCSSGSTGEEVVTRELRLVKTASSCSGASVVRLRLRMVVSNDSEFPRLGGGLRSKSSSTLASLAWVLKDELSKRPKVGKRTRGRPELLALVVVGAAVAVAVELCARPRGGNRVFAGNRSSATGSWAGRPRDLGATVVEGRISFCSGLDRLIVVY